MRVIKPTVCALLILGFAEVAYGQGFRGIVPLHSTCEDVKRVLGVSGCEPSTTYEAGNERIKILLSKAPCERAWQKSWNVPPGTVMSVERSFVTPIPLSDLNVELGRYEKSDLNGGQSTYISNEDGVIILESGGRVSSVAYAPSSKDEYLVCSEEPEPRQDANQTELPTRWFDRYGDLPFSKEKKRLDILAEELKVQPPSTEIYLVVHYTRRHHKNASLARVEHAKNYLVQTYGIDQSRIKALDGGLKKEFEVVVYIKAVAR